VRFITVPDVPRTRPPREATRRSGVLPPMCPVHYGYPRHCCQACAVANERPRTDVAGHWMRKKGER
jgi:hypothetical protein